MDSEANQHQPKQERLRTRWTASLDKIFADLVVEQIQLGNRPNNVFDKKTWNHIRDEFNKQTDLNFNNNQLRKHLDVLRTRFYNLKSAVDQNDFAMDDSCCIGFDLWEDIVAQPKPETFRAKDCPIYEQLCTIFAESGVDGKYAQSSHYEEMDKPITFDNAVLSSCPETGTPHSETPSRLNPSWAEKTNKNMITEKKRKRPLEKTRSDHGFSEAIAEAMFEMIAASKIKKVSDTQNDYRCSISNCIGMLDEIEGIDEGLYFAALELFEDPNLRETFISIGSHETRLSWLLHLKSSIKTEC